MTSGPFTFLISIFVFCPVFAFATEASKPKTPAALAKSGSMKSSSSRETKTCSICAPLKAIEKRVSRESLKPNPDFAPMSTDAAKIIVDHSRKHSTLNDVEAGAVVGVYRALVTKDPVRAVLELTSQVLISNRETIEAKVKQLPKAESNEILEAIAIATSEQPTDYPADSQESKVTPIPAGTPGHE
ncbi:MAG: hypothetical protein V4760_04470 [Bdellovibrionota bacterium]